MSDNNLRLQVILNAVDKLTRPFRSAQASSKELAAAIQQSRARLKELDAQAGRIDGFRKASAQLAVTGNSLKAAREEAAKLATQFSATNRPTAAQARLLEQAKNRVTELQSKYNGLRQSVQRQRLALNEAGLDTKKLSSAQRELRQNADETRQALDRQQKSLKRLGEQQARMNAVRDQYSRRLEVRDRIAGAGATTTAAGVAMGAPVVAAVKSYASMEDAMKGVAKQVNGLRDDNGNRTKQFYDMQDAIKAASEQLPMENGAIDYAALVEGGARMGVTNQDDPYEEQKRDLLAFASTAAKAATAFELPADELAEGLGKIAQLYKVPTRNIEQLGDALNYLDDDGHRFTLADRGAYTGVIASWLHTREPRKKETTSVKRRRKKATTPKEPEAKQGDYLVGTDENVLVLNRTYANRSNAERAAKMQWERLQRGVASFSLQLAEGRADLYTEMPVKVTGFKQPIDDAEWTITTLTHSVSPDNGFTTSMELEVKIDGLEIE